MRSPVSVRLIPHNPRTQIRCSVYPRLQFFLWGWHIMSCFQKLTFLPVFEKRWCPTCSMQTHRSERLCGTYSWDLPCKHIHEFSWLLATLSSGKGEERESWVILCLLKDGRKTTGLGLENFISTAVVCCCQDPSMSLDGCVSPLWKPVFLSFQSWFVCRLQPYWFYLVLAL